MNELEFQEGLARFLTDPHIRDATLRGKGDAITASADVEVTERLSRIDPDRSAFFSQLLIANRLAKVSDAFPITVWALGDRIWRTMLLFNSTFPPRNPKKHAEAASFARFLRAQFEVDQAQPPWLADALAYESTVLDLRFREPGDDESAIAQLGGIYVQNRCPRLATSSRLLTLRHDVEYVVAAYERKDLAADVTEREMHLLVQVHPDGTISQDEVNLPVALFLALCSGERTLGAITCLLAEQLGDPSSVGAIEAPMLSFFHDLAERGVLYLA